jgi:signal transduction histidine kinase
MLLFSEQEFAAGGHGNLDADSIVMVTSRQATRTEVALRKERSEADYRETIVRIHQELERTSALIENLMTLARADSGSEALQVASTSLNEVLLEISEPARLLAEGKSIHYAQRLPEMPLRVSGNAPSSPTVSFELV